MKYCGAYFLFLCLFLISGCYSLTEPTKRNFSDAISNALNRRCVSIASGQSKFPAKVSDNSYSVDALNALINAGLLTVAPVQVKTSNRNKISSSHVYTLTEKGKVSLQPDSGNFCVGNFKLKEVTSFTEPSIVMWMIVSKAQYIYEVVNIPDWAKSEEIMGKFDLIDHIDGESNEKTATLVLNNDRWEAWTDLWTYHTVSDDPTL